MYSSLRTSTKYPKDDPIGSDLQRGGQSRFIGCRTGKSDSVSNIFYYLSWAVKRNNGYNVFSPPG
jgi:hypothetical protein